MNAVPILDEDTLRAGLRALSAAAPPPPLAREEASIDRARHLRVRHAATATLAAVALLVPGGMVLARLGEPRPGRLVPVASWPDRRDHTLDALGENALADWLRGEELAADETVRWLWSAQVPGTDDVAVAFATCVVDRCTRVVLARADRAEAARDDLDPDVSPWLDMTYPVDETAPPVPAVYLTPAEWGADGPANVVAVVAPPGAVRATWTSAARRPGTGGTGELAHRGGAFVGDVGYLSAQAVVTLYDRHDRVLHTGPVGSDADPLRVPNVRWVAEVDPGPEWDVESKAQFHLRDPEGFTSEDWDRGTYTVFVRCAGTVPLRVTTGPRTVSVPCDGRVHAAHADVPAPPGQDLELRYDAADSYTAVAVTVATRR